MFLGVSSIVYFVSDVQAASKWYQDVLRQSPYRDAAEFVGFELGGINLCLHPIDQKTTGGVGGQVCYWRVESLARSLAVVTQAGATLLRAPLRVPEGGLVCQVLDPFGNILGMRSFEAADTDTPG